MTITIKTEGRRSYLIGDTFAAKDAIKAAGGHWDADRKAWWLGKRDAAEQIVATLSAAPIGAPSAQAERKSDAPRDGKDSVVAGRATYKGKTYYVAGRTARGRTHYDDRVEPVVTRDGLKVLLIMRDGSSQFWSARCEVEINKSYDRPQTISGLARFAEQAKADAEIGMTPELRACQRRGWDGKVGSPSYYSSGAFDEIDQ